MLNISLCKKRSVDLTFHLTDGSFKTYNRKTTTQILLGEFHTLLLRNIKTLFIQKMKAEQK